MNLARILIRVTAVLSVLSLAGISCAQSTTIGPRSPTVNRQTALKPGMVDVENSRVFTFVKGKGIGHSHGMEARISSGHLLVGAANQAGRLMIDMKSFDADTTKARQAVGLKGTTAKWMRKQVQKEMLGKKILNVAKHPVATLEILSCTPNLNRGNPPSLNYQLAGTFNFHGVSKPVAFPVSIRQANGWLRMTGQYTFKQSDYGIKPLSKGFGSIGVADEVTVHGDILIVPSRESMAALQNTRMR